MAEPMGPGPVPTDRLRAGLAAAGAECREALSELTDVVSPFGGYRQLPLVLADVEVAIGRWEAGDTATGDALEVICGRILTGLYGTPTVPLAMGSEPWRADEARAAVAALTATA